MNNVLKEWFKRKVSNIDEDLNKFSEFVDSREDDVFYFVFAWFMAKYDNKLILDYLNNGSFANRLDRIGNAIGALREDLKDSYLFYEAQFKEGMFEAFGNEEFAQGGRC